jgi:hypothetical protein
MDQREFLNRMAAAERARQSGGRIEDDPELRKFYLDRISQEGWNQPIEPPKPDPERQANQQIKKAVESKDLTGLDNDLNDRLGIKPKAPVLPQNMSPDMARKTINPATGLPYSVGAFDDSEQQRRNEQAEMRLKYLQRLSNQGK